MKKIIKTSNAPNAIGSYSQGVEIKGTFYFSGQIGINPETNKLCDDFKSQLNQILKNVDALLDSCQLTKDNIVKTTIFLKDLKNFSEVNNAYKDYFKENFPARSCIVASNLPKNALIEIEVIACK